MCVTDAYRYAGALHGPRWTSWWAAGIWIGLSSIPLLSRAEDEAAIERPTTQEKEAESQLDAISSDERLFRNREQRRRQAVDPDRPLYHFSPPEGLMNDPNGICQWGGRFHLFYQLYPPGMNRVHWGHCYSDDLVHWRDLPIAIAPTIERSCFSGQVLVEDDRAVAIYHGVGVGNCIAIAKDPLLLDWKKHPQNPVIPNIDVDEQGMPYRVFDPCIWREPDGYYSLSGTYWKGQTGRDCQLVEHLFHSPDLASWSYLGPLIEGGFWTEPGEDGAVPNFLPIGDGKHLLLYFSHKRAAQYLIGEYDRTSHRFTPDRHGRMNYGPWVQGSLHAPSAFIDDAGRLIAVFNVRENKASVDAVLQSSSPGSWYGITTLPRALALDESGRLSVSPIEELKSLRCDHRQSPPMAIPANEEVVLEGIDGKSIEIDATFDPGDAREFGLKVLRSPDGQEQTSITVFMHTYEKHGRQISIDVSRSSLSPKVRSRSAEIGPFEHPDGTPIRLRVFVDRSIVEVFVEDQQCLTLRAYPVRGDSEQVSVFARGSDAKLMSLSRWRMRSIWDEADVSRR